MDKMNLKKGLFGYTESSVIAYIEAINGEMKERVQTIMEENESLKGKCGQYESEKKSASEEQDELLEKINILSNEKDALEKEISELSEKITVLNAKLAEAMSDKFDYEQGQSDLADVMIEAKRFAKDMKNQTEREYALRKAQNDERILAESKRIDDCISDIDEICGVLRRIYKNLGEEVEKQKLDLNVVGNNLKVLKFK